MSIDNSGAVRAMVGGYDYANSQFDRASEARRQPGSAFKPFVFMAALEQGRTPDSVRNDAPIKIGKWTPENYNGKYFGKVTLATALAKSLNSVAAQLAMEVGPAAVVEAAHRMGIESELQANTSIALGTSEVTPLELTAAYVPFANGGYRPDVHFVQRITTTDGEVLYEFTGGNNPRVVRSDVVGMMNSMMTGTVETGTAKKAAFAWPAAGKTGTSQKSRDAWFVGYTANLTTGVWFGNDDGAPMKKVTGGALPAQAWHEFMVAAHEGVPVAALPGTWRTGDGGVTARPEVSLDGNTESFPRGSRAAGAKPGARTTAAGRADVLDPAHGAAGRCRPAGAAPLDLDPRYPDGRLSPQAAGFSGGGGARSVIRQTRFGGSAYDLLDDAARDLALAHDHRIRAKPGQMLDLRIGMRPRNDIDRRDWRRAPEDDLAGLEGVGDGEDQPLARRRHWPRRRHRRWPHCR